MKCPSTNQSAVGIGSTHGIEFPKSISAVEKSTLQNLAKKVAELVFRFSKEVQENKMLT